MNYSLLNKTRVIYNNNNNNNNSNFIHTLLIIIMTILNHLNIDGRTINR